MLAKIALFAFLCSLSLASQSWEDDNYSKSEPQPYNFGYEVKDKDSAQYRHEESDGSGNVKGSYGYTDDKGIYREVHYVADKNGFRAQVKTNEPGTANQNPADVEVKADPQYQEHYYQPKEEIKYVHPIPVVPIEVVPVKSYHVKKYQDFSPSKDNYNKDSNVFDFDDQPLNIVNYNNQPLKSFSYQNEQLKNLDIQPVNKFNYNTQPLNAYNFSPLNGFSYQPVAFKDKYIPSKLHKKYRFQVPHYRNRYGLEESENFGSDFDGLQNNKNGDYQKIMQEIKKIANTGRSSSLIDDLGGELDFDEDIKFGNDRYNRQHRSLSKRRNLSKKIDNFFQ